MFAKWIECDRDAIGVIRLYFFVKYIDVYILMRIVYAYFYILFYGGMDNEAFDRLRSFEYTKLESFYSRNNGACSERAGA
ncbi:hypothetical protein GCM10008022_17300 [Paenibacillus hunanensis]|nr:hypothetical protein GCM10008022_17300 [Paenibacillus hunanensis]